MKNHGTPVCASTAWYRALAGGAASRAATGPNSEARVSFAFRQRTAFRARSDARSNMSLSPNVNSARAKGIADAQIPDSLPRMKIQTVIVLCVLSIMVSGCGMSDADKFIPFTLRSKDDYRPPVDPEPDVAQPVKSNPASVFVGNATDLRVAKPHLNGAHWEGCASAVTPDVSGHLSETAVAFPIESGRIGARYRVSAGHWCLSVPRQPV